MKIAYIGGAYIPSRGADSMHQMGICEAMADLGHDVVLHVRPGRERSVDDFAFYGVKPNFALVKHPRPQLRAFGALVNAAHVAHSIRSQPLPDLLYAREVYGLALSVGTGVPFVFESHWRPGALMQRQEAWLFRRPNFRRLVVISDALRRIYREFFPWLPEERIVVAHDAANPPRKTSPPPVPIARAPAALQVGYVGSMLPGYGIDIIVKAAEANPSIGFHVVGGKEETIRGWRQKTAAIANLTLHGFVEPQRLADYYASFDVVLAPFQRATRHLDWISPMKLFEYMANGKAIVCSDFPILREVLTDEVDALLVPAENVGAWSSAVERLKDPVLRRRLGEAALAALRREHTWARRADAVLAGVL